MKRIRKFISILLVAAMVVTSASVFAYATSNEIVILYTNDIHCAIDSYPAFAAYKADLIAQGKNVVVVDAGDAIQGEVIGALTEGKAIVDIMNAVGYDYAVPGNHEFDYGMDVFLDLAENNAEYEYISTNFHYLPEARSYFAPYAIEDFGELQVAFVGISTPETITKSTPEYFMNESGNFIYGFPAYPGGMTNEILYDNVQASVDKAVSEGADIVVAVGHTGILETSDGWKSTDIISNTDGIDYYIDAHSHETIESATYKNINNEDVVLTSTGTKFANFGVLTISGDKESFELLNPSDVEIKSQASKTAFDKVKEKIDGYNEDIEYLYEGIGISEAKLVAYDSDGSWAVRKRETNAGDFVADAYRAVTGADVAIANGGGIRSDVEIGNVTRKDLMDVNAFNNEMCVLEVTGQQLVDVLEHGARECPNPIGGFFQVSGITFEIHTYRETPVVTDQLDNFIEMDENKERRVQNVCVGDEPIDLDKTYTLAGSAYVLTKGGDGLTMLDGAAVVEQDSLPCDSEMLIKYFTEMLKGEITAEQYSNPDGDGRISLIYENSNAPDYSYEAKYGGTLSVTTDTPEGVFVKFVPEKTCKYIIRSESDGADTGAYLFDADGNELFGEYSDDNEENLDFELLYEFEAGKEYYLNVFAYSEDTTIMKIIIECGHSYKDGSCIVCDKICDHSEFAMLGYCPCGKIYLGKTINDGDEFDLESKVDFEKFWFRFTPEISGYYSFNSLLENADPDCVLYDSQGEWLAESLDVNGLDFNLVYYFNAGETYYFEAYNCYTEGRFTVSLDRIIHTANDGAEHELEFVEGTNSDCTEHGYTDGLYCDECEKYVYGHEELPLDEEYHIDDNFDETCDLCGKENIYDEEMCEHICHSENWFLNFIWIIGNFIHSLFGISPICICGEAHY